MSMAEAAWLEKDPERQRGSFKGRLNDILSRPPLPSTIDSYATDAFEAVVGLADEAVEYYILHDIEDGVVTYRDAENAACQKYGLGSLDAVLDFIADTVGARLHRSQRRVEATPELGAVIGHTADTDQRFPHVSSLKLLESSEANRPVNGRSLTAHFVLSTWSEQHGTSPLDIQEQVSPVDKRMIRKQPYFAFFSPADERLVLVSDARGNATFVFDTKKITEQMQGRDEVFDYTEFAKGSKTDWEAYITSGCGSKLNFSKEELFAQRLMDTLDDPTTSHRKVYTERAFLDGKPLEQRTDQVGYTTKEMLRLWQEVTGKKLTYDTLMFAVNALGMREELQRNPHLPNSFLWTPDQEQRLFAYFAERDVFSEPEVTGGESFMVRSQICKQLGIPNSTHERGLFSRALRLARQDPDFGDPTPIHSTRHGVPGYNERQVAMIAAAADQLKIQAPFPPEGVVSVYRTAKNSRVTPDQARLALEVLGWSLPKYRFGNYVSPGLSPGQIDEFLAVARSIKPRREAARRRTG